MPTWSFIFSNVASPGVLAVGMSLVILDGPLLLPQAPRPWSEHLTHARRGVEEPKLGSVDALALKLVLCHSGWPMPPLGRAAGKVRDIEVTTK
jgi:hypothetical protein